MIGNRFYTWFKNYYQWVGGAFSETLLLPLVRATAGLRAGAIRYDETTGTVETYDGTNWNAIPSASGFVPYTGATQDVNLGEQGLEAGYLQLDTTPTGTPADQGTIYWDIDAETAALIMNGTVQKVGEDVFFHVQNKTGQPIPKGSCVRFDGTDGNSGKILIAPFIANGTYPSQYFMGVTAETIANDAFGKVYHFGKIRGVNTQAYNAGDILYASTSVAGGFQTTPPVAPNNIIVVAAVISKANNGILMVRSTLGSNLNTDEAVLISGVTTNQGLFYDNGLWRNKSIATVLGYTPGTVSSVGVNTSTNGVTVSGSPITVSGNIGIDIATASGSQNGLLSSTDWTTFNNKQNALTNPVTGTGTSGQVAYFNGTTSITGESNLFWDATNDRLGIGKNNPAVALDVVGNFTLNAGLGATLNMGSTSTNTIVISNQSSSAGLNSIFFNASNFAFRVGGVVADTQALAISTAGRVLIGKEFDSGTDALQVLGSVNISSIPARTNAATIFLTTSSNQIRSRTAAEVLTDISGVPTSRTLTINGTALDLSANRSWSVGTVTSVGLSSATSGVTITDSPVTVSGTIGIAIATANGSQQGLLSGTDWTTFNNKQNAITLTTTGTSGAATLVGATLNIPQYQAQGNYITSLTGEATASGPGAASVTLSTTAVTGKLLTGLNLAGGGTIASTDSILTAFGKVQNQISAMMGGVTFQGVWNASTNTPTLTSSTGTKGHYYIVDVSGTTNLNGITDWRVGDWAIFNGSTWDKVDNTDAVSSVNGFTGAVSLTTSHITEGTNLYYLDSRSRTAISLTTTGSSGAATYDNVSGIINVPQYTLAGLGGVPTTRSITINGTALDLSADRTYSVGTVTSVGLNSTTSGVTITNTPVTTSGALTINIATASGSQQGLLSSTDWTTFNNKQNALTNPVTGTGTTGQVAYFNGTTSITSESNLFWDAANDRLGIGTSTPIYPLTVVSNSGSNAIAILGRAIDNTSSLAFNSNNGVTGYSQISAAPTYTEISVLNSGYFTIATSGQERIRLTSSGNLGLGVTPSAWDAVNTRALQLDGGSIYMYGGDRVFLGQNVFFGGLGDTYVKTAAATTYRQFNGTHAWYTAPSGTAGNAISFTQAMTLDASGRLGIGTTSPTSPFHVSFNTTNPIASFINTNTAGTGNGILIDINSQLGTDNYVLNAISNGQSRLYVREDGNVGIGTTSPSSVLEIREANRANSSNVTNFGVYTTTAQATDIGGTIGLGGLFDGSNIAPFASIRGGKENSTSGNYAGYLAFQTIPNNGVLTERMRITSGGNVVCPGDPFIYSNTSAGGTAIHSGLRLHSTDKYVRFFTNDLGRMEVKANGQVRFTPLASDPGGAESGDVYYNSGTNKLRVYNGTSWVDLH